MLIGLDHDGTYDLDPEFWDQVIELARGRGHRVVKVSCRQLTEENLADIDHPVIATFLTSGCPKRWYMSQMGVSVDCWVDNEPEPIINGR